MDNMGDAENNRQVRLKPSGTSEGHILATMSEIVLEGCTSAERGDEYSRDVGDRSNCDGIDDCLTGDEDDLQAECDYGDEDDDIDMDYYDDDYDDISDEADAEHLTEDGDPEDFEYDCWKMKDVERWMDGIVDSVCEKAQVQLSPDLVKKLLKNCGWDTQKIVARLQESPQKTLVESKILPDTDTEAMVPEWSAECAVCFCSLDETVSLGSSCSHIFCQECWLNYLDTQIQNGVTTDLECMELDCNILLPEHFVLRVLQNSKLRFSYKQKLISQYTESHPELRYCPGPDCNVIVHAPSPRPGRVSCPECQSLSCFSCGVEYHAPVSCDKMTDWQKRCSDDTETANYLTAYTKDCPKCHTAIEKNGGCNHMTCQKCRHDFCWLCRVDWRSHKDCNQYPESSNVNEAKQSLSRYLFYFERWEEHGKSLKLEEVTRQTLLKRINHKVMEEKGTWIDWQYLTDAAALLQKCRYTLKFTYPYAYYLESGPRKTLFEYQQAQLEKEVEELSWKMERAEVTDKWEMAKQMDVAEKRRLTLLRDFLVVTSTRI